MACIRPLFINKLLEVNKTSQHIVETWQFFSEEDKEEREGMGKEGKSKQPGKESCSIVKTAHWIKLAKRKMRDLFEIKP